LEGLLSEPGAIPSLEEMGVRMAGEALVIEFFALVDRVDLDAAVGLYTGDAVFLGARGRVEIRATMERGLAANAGVRSRHVIANLRSRLVGGNLLVQFTNVAYTLDDSEEPAHDPVSARSVLDQEMLIRRESGSNLRIAEHRIIGYQVP
jgi:hypothetical protein